MENIEAMLCAYVEGDLDEAGRAQIEKHLQSNPQHRKLLSDLAQMREMVKALPRAKAPMEIEESLGQKVERSMLLEDAAAVEPVGRGADRWPQVFAIAAMFLLVSALCFIVYHALAPTMKPAQFTQAPADKFQSLLAMPENSNAGGANGAGAGVAISGNTKFSEEAPGRLNDTKFEMSMDQAKKPDASANATNARRDVAAAPAQQDWSMQQGAASQNRVASQVQNFVSQAQSQVGAIAQVDLMAIRRRLENRGYSMEQNGNNKNGSATLVLVNSSDIPATKQQIAHFLTNSNGISWDAVPEESELSSAKNLPGGNAGNFGFANNAGSQGGVDGNISNSNVGAGGYGGGGAASQQGAAAMPSQALANQPQSRSLAFKIATTEPSDMYVARGLTVQQVDALRQTLAVQQNGAAAQVTVQAVEGLPVDESATTQPAVAMPKDVTVMGTPAPASQPSELMKSDIDAAAPLVAAPVAVSPAPSSAPPTTQPANQADSIDRLADKGTSQNELPLQQVDAVIVVQPASASVVSVPPVVNGAAASVAAPTTQPAQAGEDANVPMGTAGAATQPAKFAEPATRPE